MTKYLILLVISFSAIATTFKPVPIKKQISESSGFVEGEVINTSSLEDENGRIITRVFLRADKWIGVNPVDNHLEVFYPGGVIGDKAFKIEGAPSFIQGERVLLMLKEHKEKSWIMNLALGKFMVKTYGSTEVLINSIFPNHHRVGQIPLNSFYELAKRTKQRTVKTRSKDKYEVQFEKHSQSLKTKKRNSRSIASIKTFEQEQEETKVSTFWILVILASLGALVSFSRRKNTE